MTLLLLITIVLAGVAVGFLSALLGVGGGILMVPFMVLALDKGQHVAEGTSLLVIIPTAIAGVLAHRRRGYIEWRHAFALAIGGIGGAFGGARLALLMEGSTLELLFGAFLTVAGVRLMATGARLRPREAATLNDESTTSSDA